MLLLIDGDYLLARMLHTPALWILTAEVEYRDQEGGTHKRIARTGGIYGAIKGLLGALGRFPVNRALLIFGKDRSPRRLALYPDYKGTISKAVNRDPSEEAARTEYAQASSDNRYFLKSVLPALGVRVFQARYEADDIICHVARNCETRDESVVIMSDDKDMLTLVTTGVSVFRPIADQHVHTMNFRELVGLPGPAQYLLAKCLIGDTSDCIPGVPGVGEKTAKSLASRTSGTVESLFSAAQASTSKRERCILEHRDIVERNLQLMDMYEECYSGMITAEESNAVINLLDQPMATNVPKTIEYLSRLQCHKLIADSPTWLLLFQRLR